MTLQIGVGKGKLVSAHAMRVYRWSRGMAPLILNPGARWKLNHQHHKAATLLPVKNQRYLLEEKAGWAPEPIWTFWRKDRSLSPARIWTSDCTEITWSLYALHYCGFPCKTEQEQNFIKATLSSWQSHIPWKSQSSGMWCRVTGQIVSDILKHHSAFVFTIQQSKMNPLPWRGGNTTNTW